MGEELFSAYSIDTQLLYQISSVLKYDFFEQYSKLLRETAEKTNK